MIKRRLAFAIPALAALLLVSTASVHGVDDKLGSGAPPKIETMSPLPGSRNSDTDLTVEAVLSAPVDPATVDKASFYLTGPDGIVPARVSYDEGSSTAVLDPSEPLDGDSYLATLTNAIEGINGKRLVSTRSWRFYMTEEAGDDSGDEESPPAAPVEETPTPTNTPRLAPTPTPTSAPEPTPSPEPDDEPSPDDSGYQSHDCFEVGGESNQVYENLDIGPCPGETGIYIYGSTNITIRNVRITNACASIEADDSSNITIDGLVSIDPTCPIPQGQHVQFDGTDGGVVRNSYGTGALEDGFSAYKSTNILFEYNEAIDGTSDSGCAFIADDDSHDVTFRNNRAIDNVNCGIGIAAGTGHLVEGNYLENCKPHSDGFDAACLYVWNQYPEPCGDIVVRNNTIVDDNPWWDGGNCSNLTISGID